MARSGTVSRPGRALFALVALLGIIFGSIAIGTVTSNAQWTPKLALDLEGGTQIILTPKPLAGEQGAITKSQITEAVNIIRQRVNGSGVSEAEVTTQGADNIVVALPGNPDEKTRNLVKQSAELTFRPVLIAASAAPPAPAPSGTASAGGTPAPTASGKASKSTGTPTAATTPKPSATNGRIVPKALTKTAATAKPSAGSAGSQIEPSASAAPDPAAPDAATPDPGAAAGAAATGTASDLAQITPAIEKEFTALQCTQLDELQSQPQNATKPLVTCSQDGLEKFILGPVEVRGTDIKTATAGLGTNSQGFSTGQWQVLLDFNSAGAKKFADVTERLAALTGAQNQFAIVLDRLVVSAPTTNERIPTGQAQISGSFTQASATQLASQLKFGALPVSFVVETEDQISALLGGEQLERGLLAGLIGLVLVVIYSLLQYRALGLVTVFSLAIAAAFTYGLVVLLGWTQGFRVSLPAVCGLIVAIGITADSFIVYFERVRDEVREGRPLKFAVEAAWLRARRTILVSDAVSFLAAVVLYVLAVGGVRGFAFTLGLTTLIDVLVVFLFTKPAVTLLSRTHFFGGGHPLSGFSPEQLGRVAAPYAGRGRVRTPGDSGSEGRGGSIAERRAARLAEEQERASAESDVDGSDVDSNEDVTSGAGSGDGGAGGKGRRGQAKSAGKGRGTAKGRVSAGRSTGNRRDV